MALILPPNWCLIFFRDAERSMTIARVAELLRADGLAVAGPSTDDRLSVNYGDGPTLKVSVHRSSEQEAIVRGLLGRTRKYDLLLRGLDSDIRIELEDVAAVLDETNTLIQTQLVLQDATRGLMYLGWNDTFAGPKE